MITLSRHFDHAVRELLSGNLSMSILPRIISEAETISREGRQNLPLTNDENDKDKDAQDLLGEWIKFAILFLIQPRSNLIDKLNTKLLSSSYISSPCYITGSDIYVFVATSSFVISKKENPTQYLGIFRWYKQLLNYIPGAVHILGEMNFHLSLPIKKIDLLACKSKEKENNIISAENCLLANSLELENSTAANKKKKEKKIIAVNAKKCGIEGESLIDVKEKPNNTLQLPPPSCLDIRVGKILDISRHPDADSLYVEQIDLGEAKPRTVVSGLVKHVPINEMLGRLVMVVCNLKPAKMRGILSEGMVLCSSKDEKIELLSPPKDSTAGDIAEFQGFENGHADPVLNPKKKIWEKIQPYLVTNSDGVAGYCGENEVHHVLSVNGNVVNAQNHRGSTIS